MTLLRVALPEVLVILTLQVASLGSQVKGSGIVMSSIYLWKLGPAAKSAIIMTNDRIYMYPIY